MVVSSWRESFPSVGKRAQPLSYVTSVIGNRPALSTGILKIHCSCSECGEEGGDDVKSAWPFDALGYTHVTMGLTMRC